MKNTNPGLSKMKKRPAVWQIAAIAFFVFYMFVPIISTYVFSIATRWDRTILPEGYTVQSYSRAFQATNFIITLRNSLVLSIGAVIVSLMIIVPTVYWVFTRIPRAKSLLEILMILPFGIPTVVLALALIRVYSLTPLSRSPILLMGAVVVYSMPFMYRPVANAMHAIDAHTLTEAGQSLGANTFKVLMSIIVPNILPGILSGSLLVFATVFAEFTLTRLIVGASFKTFPLLLVEYTRINGNVAASFSVISFTIAWLASILILRVGSKDNSIQTEAIQAH
jgi:putative spermidine/putrescine transport system permease protein